jgi:PadR family transcriptional regulator PadR
MTIEGEFLRGAGPVAVLKLLERGEMYGYEIVEALERRTDGVLALGQSTLYPMLYNLEAKGFVSSRWDEETAARPRKYYRLTPDGKKRLAEDTKTWRRLTTAMGALGLTRSLLPMPAPRVTATFPPSATLTGGFR